MKLGIVAYSNDAETVWNAFRLGMFALKKGDTVRAFLLGKGVECEKHRHGEVRGDGPDEVFRVCGRQDSRVWHLSEDSPFRGVGDVSTLDNGRSLRIVQESTVFTF